MPTAFRPYLAALIVCATALAPAARADFVTATFEDVNPGVNSFKNDFRPTNGFTSGGFFFNNNYNAAFGAWSGFSASSKVDNTFGGPSYDHLYGAYAPTVGGFTGAGGSATYAVASNYSIGEAFINVPTGYAISSFDVTNTTYTAQSVTLGDTFARAFRPGDYLQLDVIGYSGLNATGSQIGSVSLTLADYRGASLTLINQWTTLNLSSLAGARSLAFELTSTDVGPFGMNTPATFALDNVVAVSTAVPEPGSVALLGVGLGLVGFRLRRRRA